MGMYDYWEEKKQRDSLYDEGYEDGVEYGMKTWLQKWPWRNSVDRKRGRASNAGKPKRKLSAWQKYIKNKRNHIKYRDGKLNLKKMAVAFRRKNVNEPIK